MAAVDHPVISTKLGKIRGSIVELQNSTNVEVFRNIPFAKPPTGEGRFMPPEPAEAWIGIRDGTRPGNMPMCITGYDDAMDKIFPHAQSDDEYPKVQDEDCLNLSIYAPAERKGKKLAVMVWFYGGGFQSGSERRYEGTVLAGMNDVIVVVPNYRVGIMGFFNLGPKSPCSGNAGLLDQQRALRWVQEHIEEFGGDRNNVTIFGQSAGAASVHLNVLSPMAKGLFHKAISHSGQKHLVELFETNEHLDRVNKALLKHLKIEHDNDRDILKAMQEIPAKTLIEASAALIGEMVFFSPIVDGKVLPKTTGELLKDKAFPKVPYIIGCNNTEGDGILAMMSPVGNFAKGFTEDQARMSMMLPVTDEGWKMVSKRYLRDEDGETKYSQCLGRITEDASFISPAIESAIAHHEGGGDVYCYVGGFQMKMTHDDTYSDLQKKPDWCDCDHGDEIFMTLGAPFSPVKLTMNATFSEDEKKLSKAFMTYLTNFAKTGNPNEGRPVTVEWPKYTPDGKNLFVNRTMSVEKNLDVKVMNFWRKEMAQHMKSFGC